MSCINLILVNIYAPNDANQQITFFKELENQLKTLPKRILLSQVTLTTLCLKMKMVATQFGKNPQHLKKFSILRNKIAENPMPTRLLFNFERTQMHDTDACNIINAPETDHSAITLHTMASRL